MPQRKAAVPYDKLEVNQDFVAAICVTVNDGSDCDEIWYLTNEQDAILDADQVLFVSTPEELLEELEVKYFCDEGLSKVIVSTIYSQRVYDHKEGCYNEVYQDYKQLGGKAGVKSKTLDVIRKRVIPAESEYIKKENIFYNNERDKSKLIFKVLSVPVITTADVNIVMEAVKKYGVLYLGIKPSNISKEYQVVGMTNYLSDDIKVVDYARLEYIPGIKAKHKRRLASYRKRRAKVGKLSYSEILIPLAKVVTNGLQEIVNKIIVKDDMVGCIELSVSHPDLKSREAAMKIIADGISTIRSLDKGKEYQSGTYSYHGRWDNKKYQIKNLHFADLIKACAPSIESLVKSKEEHKAAFGKAIQIEYIDLVKRGKIKE